MTGVVLGLGKYSLHNNRWFHQGQIYCLSQPCHLCSKALYFGWVLLLGWELRKLPFCYGSSVSTPLFGAANAALNIHRIVIKFYHCADCHRHARWCSRNKNLLNTRNKFFLTLTDRQVQAQEQTTKMWVQQRGKHIRTIQQNPQT